MDKGIFLLFTLLWLGSILSLVNSLTGNYWISYGGDFKAGLLNSCNGDDCTSKGETDVLLPNNDFAVKLLGIDQAFYVFTFVQIILLILNTLISLVLWRQAKHGNSRHIFVLSRILHCWNVAFGVASWAIYFSWCGQNLVQYYSSFVKVFQQPLVANGTQVVSSTQQFEIVFPLGSNALWHAISLWFFWHLELWFITKIERMWKNNKAGEKLKQTIRTVSSSV